MIRLHPIPEGTAYNCPVCHTGLAAKGWYIPGMRNLADLACAGCGREFYGDLFAGQALYTPVLLDKASGTVHHPFPPFWFAEWLEKSYARRVNSAVGFTVESFRTLKTPVLLNCLDTLYGHGLLKLLNAQHYLEQCPEMELVVLVPHYLRWMVPDGVAAVWTLDLPVRRGVEWNDWVAQKIRQQFDSLEGAWLSLAFSHPHPDSYKIEKFTRVHPFPIEEWNDRLRNPKVTFIYREDRIWHPQANSTSRIGRLKSKFTRRIGWNAVQQRGRIVAFARRLRQSFAGLDFAIVGLAQAGGLPQWISDLRTEQISEVMERKWCERYASSHVVIGVHGSNMLLPSAHAGAVVELMPAARWGNMLQDFLFNRGDTRETLFRCRVLPLSTSPADLADSVSSLLMDFNNCFITMEPTFCKHGTTPDVRKWAVAWQRHLEARSAAIRVVG